MRRSALLASGGFLAGLAILAFVQLPSWALGRGRASEPVMATVVGREVGKARWIMVRYRWIVDGVTHETEVGVTDDTPLTVEPDGRRVQDLAAGDSLRVYVAPGHPRRSSLRPEPLLGPDGGWILAGALLVVAGAGAAIAGRRRRA